jgi:hypothetical protein
MARGDLIQDVDYNTIRNDIIAVLGSGSGTFGYGQDSKIQSSAVADGQTVTAAQYQNLRFDIFNCLLHQTGNNPSISTVNPTNVITFGAGQPINGYATLTATARTNRFNLGSGRSQTVEDVGDTSSGDRSWTRNANVVITYTWPSSNAARWFFNAGGRILVETNFDPAVTTQQTTNWQTILGASLQQGFGGQFPNTGFTPLNGTNYYRCTNQFQTYYTKFGTGKYSANTYRLQARTNVANNSAGTATQLLIRVLLTDDYVDPGDNPGDVPRTNDDVNGDISVSTDVLLPGGILQPAPANGNLVVSGPSSVSFSAFSFDLVTIPSS